MPPQPLHIVHLEDDSADAEFVRVQFDIGGLPCVVRQATNRAEFCAALEHPSVDLIISDFSLPGFDGLSALDIAREKQPGVPFIFCTGAMGEEAAVESLKRGAVDYVLKDRIAKLVPAVRRALAEREEHFKRLQAEAALRESEERYRQLFHESSDMVVVAKFDPTTGESGPILEINDTGVRLLARPREALLGQPLAHFEVSGQPAVSEVMTERLIKGEEAVFERILVDREGRRIGVEIKSRQIQWQGQAALMSLLRDVTERRQTEMAMRVLSTDLARMTGARFFRDVVSCAARLLEVEIAFVNRLRPGRIPEPETLALFIDGVLLATPAQTVAASLTAGPDRSSEFVIASDAPSQLPDDPFAQQNRVQAVVAVPLVDTAGNLLGQLGIMSRRAVHNTHRLVSLLRLFAVRTASELEHQRSAKRFGDLFEFAPDAIILVDASGHIALANRRSEVLLGWSRTELIGKEVDVLEPPAKKEGAPTLRSLFLAPMPQSSASRAELEPRVRRKDGSVFHADITTSPLETESGPVTAAAIRDVSAQREAEGQMLRAQRLECLGTLAGGIAHDLNNVLTPILGGAELILERSPAATDRAILENVAASARRGANMVRQLLAFGRGNEGRRAPVDVETHLHEIARIIDNSFPKNIRLNVDLGRDLHTVEADSTELHQVLLNLCVNARDAMPDGGVLRLSAANVVVDEAFAANQPDATPGTYVSIKVADTGTGIPREILDRIFEPFFTTKDIAQGTGLGLSTVRGIVKGSGGFLQVQSEPRRGSTFTVYLPSMQASCTAVEEPVADSSQTPVGKGETILISDDEPLVRQTMKTALSRAGFNVVEAADGTGALVQAAKLGAQLRAIVTDINMPQMDGVALVRAVRRILPKVFIVAVSGRHEPARTQILRSLGVTEILDKPYNLQTLLAALRKGLSD